MNEDNNYANGINEDSGYPNSIMEEPNSLKAPSSKNKNNKGLLIGLIVIIVIAILTVIISYAVKKKIEKDTYKLIYTEYISQYSAEYDLDPYLIAAMIHVESANKPAAHSSKGAIGLMQIMPETGEWLAGKLKIEDYDESMLEDEKINIMMGCFYMRFIFDRIANTDSAIAAYNAGHNIVKKWLSDEKYSNDSISLHYIPYEETRSYVEKVKRCREIYQRLYPRAFEI